MNDFHQRTLALFEVIHPLDRIARAGFVLRGVAEPESVAAHSHFVAVLTLLFIKQYPDRYDAGKALAMALLHDLCEARLMDIPMPVLDTGLKEAKEQAEQVIDKALFEGLPGDLAAITAEAAEGKTPEARLVRGLDKAQMMVKVVLYQRENRGRLDEFWANPKNFADYGLPEVSGFFDAICAWAGKTRPK